MEEVQAKADESQKGKRWSLFWPILLGLFVTYMLVSLYGQARDAFSKDHHLVQRLKDEDYSVNCYLYRNSIACVPVGSEDIAAEVLDVPASFLQNRTVASTCNPLGLQPYPNSCYRH